MTAPKTSVVHFRVLGPVAVTTGADRSVKPLLTQPRRLAVLTYLVLARPRGFHSRDTLVAMLWPEADQGGGRHALRNVLHALRQAVGGAVIIVAGDGMVGVDPDQISCDAVQLERDLAEGRVDDAIARYHGELLQGFHVSDAPEFERWLDAERRRFVQLLLAGAWNHAESKEKAGDAKGALQIARRAAEIAPDDEPSLRRLLAFLDRAGDRFGAVRAYDEFAERLKREYGAEPSAETKGVARALRESTTTAEHARLPTTPRSEPVDLSPSPSAPRAAPTTATVLSDSAGPSESTMKPGYRPIWRWIIAAAVLAAIVMVAAIPRTRRMPDSFAAPNKLLVLPMENETGDPSVDYVGSGLTDGIARRLEGIGGITVRSGARSDWPAATRHDFKALGRQFGSVILLKTVLARANDSLEVRASVLDLATSKEKPIATRRFTTEGLLDMESSLAASVAGAVFRVPLPHAAARESRPINPESYRLTLDGWHQLRTLRNSERAQTLFIEATRVDPTNASAWAGLADVLGLGGVAGIGENMDDIEAAAGRALALDSLQGTALASMGFARAFRYRNLADGLEWLRKAIAVDPSNPEVFMGLSSLYRQAWMWDQTRDAARISEELDPLSSFYLGREAFGEICAGRTARALQIYERAVSLDPADTASRMGLTRALALRGRYDDAIAEWRRASAGDPVVLASLKEARGKSGYLSAKREMGKRRLATLMRQGGGKKNARLRLMQARFAAGDIDGGFADMDALVRERSVALYRLPCMADLDDVRDLPRYKEALRKVGPLPQH